MVRSVLPLAAAAGLLASAPAQAGELFGGVYVHDVDTAFTLSGEEDGADLMLGWRFDRIGRTPLQPYAFVAVNSAGGTNYGAVGLSARFGDRVYVRPGLGLAIHTGSSRDVQDPTNDRVEFGNRLLLEPELGIGARINDRLSIEASWVHLSHGRLFGRQNPGMDNFGLRLNLAIP